MLMHLPSFTQTDIHELAADLVTTILSKIEVAQNPEKMAENDHLMRCWFSLLTILVCI
jgi:hypothetical protein